MSRRRSSTVPPLTGRTWRGTNGPKPPPSLKGREGRVRVGEQPATAGPRHELPEGQLTETSGGGTCGNDHRLQGVGPGRSPRLDGAERRVEEVGQGGEADP